MSAPFRARIPLLVLLLVAAACAAPRAAAPVTASPGPSATPNFEGRTLNVVTGPTGGGYIVYGAGPPGGLTKGVKGAARAQQATAAVENMKVIGPGKADLALSLAE